MQVAILRTDCPSLIGRHSEFCSESFAGSGLRKQEIMIIVVTIVVIVLVFGSDSVCVMSLLVSL